MANTLPKQKEDREDLYFQVRSIDALLMTFEARAEDGEYAAVQLAEMREDV